MRKKHKPGRQSTPAVDATVRKINWAALAAASRSQEQPVNLWTIPKPAPGVGPPNAAIAMDEAFCDINTYGSSNYGFKTGYGEGLSFLGFPMLSEMAQRAEYRRMVTVYAQELTRRWCKLTSKGDGDKSGRIAKLEEAMTKFRIQDVFREAAEQDGFFGIGHIYIDLGNANPEELRTPLLFRPEKIGKGSLKRIRSIEPVWCYPTSFNSINPLLPDFYRPQSWHIMNVEVHCTRLLSLVSREIPDLLKPSYQFAGVSLTQIAHQTVERWLKIATSVSEVVESYTVWQLATNMQSTLMGIGGDDMLNRAATFAQFRKNRGLLLTDKETEELHNVSSPLGGLDALQGQSQQQIAAACGIPITKLLGTPPTGLNASSEGEIKSFYDTIAAQQRHLFNDPLKRVLDVIQLSEFGDIDDSISFEWLSLEDPNEAERAVVRKTDVDTAVELINAGVLHPEEERQRLANSEDSLYHGLDVNDVPDPPEAPADPSLLPDPAKAEATESEA